MALRIHTVDLVPGDPELRACRDRLHGAYVEARGLTRSLLAELEAQRKGNSSRYRYLLQELLAWAAYYQDMETFESLLDLARRWQEETGLAFGLLRRMRPEWFQRPDGQQPPPDSLHLDCRHALLIAEKEPFLRRLVEVLGTDMRCRGELWQYNTSGCLQMGFRLLSDLPDPVLAALCGLEDTVRLLVDRGLCGDGAVSGGAGSGVVRIMDNRYRCRSMLTAALRSWSPTLLDLTLEEFPKLRFRREMLGPLGSAEGETQRRFLAARPETVEALTWRDLLRAPCPVLAEALLDRDGRAPALAPSVDPLSPWTMDSQRLDTLRLLCRHGADEAARLEYLRACLRCLAGVGGPLTAWRPDGEDYRFVLEQLPTGSDVTPLLGPMAQRGQVLRGLLALYRWDSSPAKARTLAYRVDLYSLGASCFRHMDRADLVKFLNTFTPLRILARPDQLSRRIITRGQGDLELAALAIRRGFITQVNAPFIRLPKRGGGELARLLLRLRRDRLLGSQYDWRNAR